MGLHLDFLKEPWVAHAQNSPASVEIGHTSELIAEAADFFPQGNIKRGHLPTPSPTAL